VLSNLARLDVRGSFHASTADQLRLGEYVFGAGTSTAVVAAPGDVLALPDIAAFGFLDDEVAPLQVGQFTELSVPSGQTLSLIGGDITAGANLYGNPILRAPAGRINLASVDSRGTVVMREPGMFREFEVLPTSPDDPGVLADRSEALDVSSFARLGSIELEETLLDVGDDANPVGKIYLRAGSAQLTNSYVFTGGELSDPDSGIDLSVTGDLVLDNTRLSTGGPSTLRVSSGTLSAHDSELAATGEYGGGVIGSSVSAPRASRTRRSARTVSRRLRAV
jgi:hypothetical protein